MTKLFQWIYGVLVRITLVPAFILRGYASPGMYGLPTFCNWEQMPGKMSLEAGEDGAMAIKPPGNVRYFHPEAVYMFAYFSDTPGSNARFTIRGIEIGGNEYAPLRKRNFVRDELLSDVFNRSDEPLRINWEDISNSGVKVYVRNINDKKISIFVLIWGIPMSSPGLWGRIKAYFGK